MLLMIDNYDSFTFNLVQYLGQLGQQVEVYRNDAIDLAQIEKLAPRYIVISPGPGTPDEAGICLSLVAHFAGKIPILGVCLGHQTIGQVFGGTVSHAKSLMHGKTSLIRHTNQGVFSGLPNPFTATRYHSLVVAPDSIPDSLQVTAHTDDGEIMGFRHTSYAVEGVQFHPESILTEHGHDLLQNFLQQN